MAQAQLSSVDIEETLGIKSNIFDKTAQMSATSGRKVFEKFNGHEGDEYMLIFGVGMLNITDTDRKLGSDGIKCAEKQTAILAIAKSLEGMKDLGTMLKFLEQMKVTFKNDPSVTNWIDEKISNVKSGVLDNAGKEIYWSLMHHWLGDQEAIFNAYPSLAFQLAGKNQAQAQAIIQSFIKNHPSMDPKIKGDMEDYESNFDCFYWRRHGFLGFGNRYIEPNILAIWYKYEAAMKSRFGSNISPTELHQAFYVTEFKEAYYNWFGTHTFDANISNEVIDFQNQMDVGARQVANTSRAFANSATTNLSDIMGVLEGFTSEDQQISNMIQTLVVNPEDMHH